jgi:hypothetical protein
METSKIFAVHILGMMTGTQTVLVTGFTIWHAIDKTAYTFDVPNSKVLVKDGPNFYRGYNGKLWKVDPVAEAIKVKAAQAIINKM